jgi:hypothetical protein
MKKIILLIVLCLGAKSFAQTNGITYQAVILNPNGEQLPGVNNTNAPMVDKNICLQFQFIDAFAKLEYQETIQTKTDSFGMVNLVIGSGKQTAGYAASFQSIEWNALKKSMIVSINTSGSCSSFTEISNQPFTAVPFAFSAINSGNVTGVVDIQNGGTNAVTIIGAKTNLGLEKLDNTSDLDKPISNATLVALNLNTSAISVNATAISLNTAKTGMTNQQASAITANTAKVGYTDALVSANTDVAANNAKTGITAQQASDITANNAKTGITSQQSNDITTNNAKVSYPGDQDLSALATTAATMTALNLKADLASPTFTGIPTLPTGTTAVTQSANNNSTALATTEYVDNQIVLGTATNVSGVVAIANGGTGSSTQNFVDLNTDQSIAGNKTFSNNTIVNGTSTANSFNTPAGTSSQFLKADGSIDSNNYFLPNTSNIAIGYVAGTGGQGVHSIAIGGNVAQGAQAEGGVGLGYAAAQYSQGLNAVAIGSFAGNNGQHDNSIVINASGNSLNGNANSGLYIDPIRSASGASSLFYDTTTKEITYGTAAQNFVDLTNDQTISGTKVFSSNASFNGQKIGKGNATGGENLAVGDGAMNGTSTGVRNTAIGNSAMQNYVGTSFDNNTSVGYANLVGMTSGSGNTSVGAESMMALTTGTENTSVGNQSLINTTGNNNVGIGKRAGQTISSGSQNTIIGTNADVGTNNLTNATALGYGAIVAASNKIQLGNGSVTAVQLGTGTNVTLETGLVKITGGAPGANKVLTSDANGLASWATPSSGTPSEYAYMNLGNGISATSADLNAYVRLDAMWPSGTYVNGIVVNSDSFVLKANKMYEVTVHFSVYNNKSSSNHTFLMWNVNRGGSLGTEMNVFTTDRGTTTTNFLIKESTDTTIALIHFTGAEANLMGRVVVKEIK